MPNFVEIFIRTYIRMYVHFLVFFFCHTRPDSVLDEEELLQQGINLPESCIA